MARGALESSHAVAARRVPAWHMDSLVCSMDCLALVKADHLPGSTGLRASEGHQGLEAQLRPVRCLQAQALARALRAPTSRASAESSALPHPTNA